MLHWTTGLNQIASRRPATSSSGDLAWQSPIVESPDYAVSHQVMASAIDAYFANYHTSYPFLHEATFRAQYSELVERPDDRTWNILLYTVLALGAWTVGEEDGHLHDLFYRKASAYWQERSVFESASLTTVQALVLLSNYTQKRNKPNTGWNYLGLAVRMAVSLGLHRELPEWNITLLQREMRRRVWWGLFIFDSGASVTFGRAILLPEENMIDVKSVMNIPDAVGWPLLQMDVSDIAQGTDSNDLRHPARV
jgi:transcriptional regulatory protein GAL4